MATVNATLTMNSSDLTSDAISLSVLNTLSSATQGGISRVKLATQAISGATVLAPAAKFTEGARIWLYNPATSASAANTVTVSLDQAASTIVLNAGDWAIIPWSASTRTTDKNLMAFGGSADLIIEFGVFQ
tara:strand:+ start:19078 stop:19470 length:393 start_codon:yes stop_codon:yes gene_type:complete